MKTLFLTSLTLVVLFSFQSSVFWSVLECDSKQWYELYECRKKEVCDVKWREPDKLIYNSDTDEWSYFEVETGDKDFFVEAQTRYRTNMNNLYKCSLIQLRINALKEVIAIPKAKVIQEKMDANIKQRIEKLDRKKTICGNIDDVSTYNKRAVLQQSTYEICKYLNYLEYLDDHTDTLWNVTDAEWKINIIRLTADQSRLKNAIQDEFENSIKVFPLAFTAYSQYENNIGIHLMLELVREDFVVFRKRLHSVLWPISQLVYKANNAMWIHP